MKKIKKALVLVLCFSLMTMLLSACAGGNDGSSEDKDASQAELETTTVRLALASNGHVLNAIAEEQGYLEEEGLTVEYVPLDINNDNAVFEAIQKGTIDIFSNSGTNLPLQHISQGEDLTVFAGYLVTGCMPIFAKVDTKWTSIEDLVGKTMACEANMYAVSGPLLDKGHDPLKDVKWLEVDEQTDRIEAVKSGKADFGLVGTSLNYAINTDPDLKVVTYASDVMPEYSCCRAVASTEWINNNPNTVKALLRAWIRAMDYYDSHHEEAVALIHEITGEEEAFIRAYMDNPHYDLNPDPLKSSVLRAWDYMDKMGLLDKNAKQMNIEDHINTELYNEALDECQEKYGKDSRVFYEEMQGMYARHN